VPGGAANTRPRIFEWLELQAIGIDADGGAVAQEKVPIGRDEVGERAALPSVSVQPEPAIHCVDHPLAAFVEFSKLRSLARGTSGHPYWQVTTPATVAGATAAAVPMKRAQKCGYDSGCVAVADQPTLVASVTTT